MTLRWFRLLMVGSLLLASCGVDEEPPATIDDLQGYWWLESWGDATSDHYPATTRERVWSSIHPWVHFGETIEGSGGCSQFSSAVGSYRVEGGLLLPGEVQFVTGTCPTSDAGGDPMLSDEVIQRFLGEAEGFEISFGNMGHQMHWSNGTIGINWMKVDREPPPGGIWVNPPESNG